MHHFSACARIVLPLNRESHLLVLTQHFLLTSDNKPGIAFPQEALNGSALVIGSGEGGSDGEKRSRGRAGHRPQATGHRPQATGHRPQATGHRPQATKNPLKHYNTKRFKRKTPFQFILFSALLALFFAGCGDDKTNVTDIALSKSTLKLEVGQEERLHATLKPDNAANQGLQWKSDDENVARVEDGGLVRAVSTGQTVVYAISADGKKTASCKVEVIVPIEGISLERCPGTLTLGSQQLRATVEPVESSNQALTWISTNPAVATVDENGLVSALAAGEATIVVSAQEAFGKTKSCRLKVAPVSGVSINGCWPGGLLHSSRQLAAVIEPSDAANKAVKWTSSNPAVATVSDSGLVSGNGGRGTTTIRVTTEDGDWTDTCEVSNYIPVESVSIGGCSTELLGIEKTRQLSATVFPSDATNRNVTWASLDPTIATVDSNGRVTAPLNSPGGTARIRVRTLEGGKEAMCAVPVPIRATSVQIIGCPEHRLNVDSGPIQLRAHVEPSNATNKAVQWHADPTLLSVDSNGRVTLKGLQGRPSVYVYVGDVMAGGKDRAECKLHIDPIVTGQNVVNSCDGVVRIYGRGFFNTQSVLHKYDISGGVQPVGFRVDSSLQITLTNVAKWTAPGYLEVDGVRSPQGFGAGCGYSL